MSIFIKTHSYIKNLETRKKELNKFPFNYQYKQPRVNESRLREAHSRLNGQNCQTKGRGGRHRERKTLRFCEITEGRVAFANAEIAKRRPPSSARRVQRLKMRPSTTKEAGVGFLMRSPMQAHGARYCRDAAGLGKNCLI